MKIILIGNYQPDKQESMNRFAMMLNIGLQKKGIETELWRPIRFFSWWSKSTNAGTGKWLGYLDKWILFPLILKFRLSKNKSVYKNDVIFHICDHSNALYLKSLPIDKTLITCHDVLAIRGALGYSDAFCPASSTGKILQKWILKNLFYAKNLIAVSELTLKQLKELKPGIKKQNWKVIPNGFNAEFMPIDREESKSVLLPTRLDLSLPFVLHVGSQLPRKNRKLLIDMVRALGDKWNGTICFAGQPVEKSLKDHAAACGLENRIISVVKPSYKTLVALYSYCDAFIFPSFSEGFGWPVIEAQACGAPVIASDIQPMPEVSGGAALHADPHRPELFASEFLRLEDDLFRSEIIRKGFANCERFSLENMIGEYLEFARGIFNNQ